MNVNKVTAGSFPASVARAVVIFFGLLGISCSPVGKQYVGEVIYNVLEVRGIEGPKQGKVGATLSLSIAYIGAECGPASALMVNQVVQDEFGRQVVLISVRSPLVPGTPMTCKQEGATTFLFTPDHAGNFRFQGSNLDSSKVVYWDVTVAP